MADVATGRGGVRLGAPASRPSGFGVVLEREARDLWAGGRGPALAFAFSLLLSVISYLLATNTALNFLEVRESVNLVAQVTIAAGTLLALLAAADAVSGERERATLEAVLLTPVGRGPLAAGKLAAALSLWLAAFAVALPYVWFFGRGIGLVGSAALVTLAVGTLLAVFLASLGLVVSVFSSSNRVSLGVSLFALAALLAPTQLPAGAQRGVAGDALLRADPLTAGETYVGKVLVNAHGVAADLGWLVSPLVAAAAGAMLACALGARCTTLSGGSGK
jgi:ABC-2 type transport system permease protein